MNPELYKLFLQMAIIGAITGIPVSYTHLTLPTKA